VDVDSLNSRPYVSLILRQTQASIRPAKAKAVCERNLHGMLLSNPGNVVAIELFRRIARTIQIECWWHYTLRKFSSAKRNIVKTLLKRKTYIADCQDGKYRLHGARSSQQVADSSFCAANIDV
jgi:hypothetical protein